MEDHSAKRARQCFERAAELRAAAEDLRHAQSRTSILRLAENYERMGRGFERAARVIQAPSGQAKESK